MGRAMGGQTMNKSHTALPEEGPGIQSTLYFS